MRKKLLVRLCKMMFFSYLGINYAFGQGSASVNPEFLPKVSVSSPEASSLGKYGDFNVSEYTGTINISIPIYTIQSGGYNYPIALNYSTSGVKVDEIHSWIGCNWSLAGVGVITRTIVGLPDESGAGFLTRNIANNGLQSNYSLDNINDLEKLSAMSDNSIDSEPDLFFFNFGNLSGKFYFDKQGNFTCVPASTLKLIKSPILNNSVNSDSEWHLQDMNGNDYYFAQAGLGIETTAEEEYGLNEGSRLTTNINGWYLTKIKIGASGDEIKFTYTNKVENYTLPAAQSLRYILDKNNQYPLIPGASDLFNENVLLHNGVNVGQVIAIPGRPPSPARLPVLKDLFFGGNCRLQKIVFPNGSVEFIANTQRQGMGFGAVMLDKILVKESQGSIIKAFETVYEVYNKRYYLKEVKSLGKENTYLASYSAEYTSPHALPKPSEGLDIIKSQDHWGYYNGKNNPTLIPSNYAINSNLSGLTGNREPDENFMKYGSIRKITYPTGGYSEFEFEANEYNPQKATAGNVPPNSAIVNKSITGSIDQITAVFEQEFTVNYAQHNAKLKIDFTDYQHAAGEETFWNVEVTISKKVNSSFNSIYLYNAWRLFDFQTAVSTSSGVFSFTLKSPISLEVGTYKISIRRYCSSGCSQPSLLPKASVVIDYIDFSGNLPKAGGLRIKQIKNYANGILATRRVYDYSFGNLLSYPKYSHVYGVVMNGAIDLEEAGGWVDLTFGFCLFQYVYFKEYSSTSQTVLGFTGGASVGYEMVKISDYDANNVDNGFTTKSFTFFNDVINENTIDYSFWYRFGFVNLLNPDFPTTNVEYKRGLIQKELVYRRTVSNLYQLAKTVDYEYVYGDYVGQPRYNSLEALRVKRIFNHRDSRVCTSLYNSFDYPAAIPSKALFSYSKYRLIAAWPRLTRKIVSDYSSSGVLSTIENIIYNEAAHLQPTEVSTSNSKGEQIRRTFTYTNNYADINLRNQLIGKNIIGEVVNEDVLLMKGSVLTPLIRQRKAFESYNGGAQIMANKFFVDYKNVNTVLPEYEILTVLPSGKPFEIKKTDGIAEIYLWGYNNQYMVAKIRGVTSQQINTFLGYNLMNTLPSLTTVQIINIAETIRGLTNAYVETYDYLPLIGLKWQKDISGKITYYTYDAINRLQLIKDQDGKILKKICYNYAGQQEDCSVNVTPLWVATGNLRCATSGGVNTGYQEREEKDNNTNSPSFNQTQWLSNGYNVSICPLPAAPCSFSIGSGFGLLTSGISSSATVVSFYIVFNSISTLSPGSSYLVATVNGGCRPSTTRTISYSSGGRNWSITINPSGQMYWYLAPGSTSLSAGSTIATSTLTYNL